MITQKRLLLFVLVSFATIFFANAHGNLTIRINKKTSEIKSNPNNAKLYFDRGFLYHQHEEYDKAILDYKKAENLGFTDKLLYYRTAETYYVWNKYKQALTESSRFLEKDKIDVKINKLHAQILFELKQYEEAVNYYTFFIDNVVDPRPGDFVEMSSYIIASQKNYNKAIQVIDTGLNKLGENVLSLRLKKMEYLKASNQVDKTIEEYNYFILQYNRKEFWYYKKAKYLTDENRLSEAKISLQFAKIAVDQLGNKFKNMQSIKKLKENIINLEQKINTSKS
jgi:tetratricopeptide (TPR) repeat protein